MLIQSPDPKTKTIHDYDFTFESGMFMPIPLEPDAGDSIKFNQDTILIQLTAKPSQTNPNVQMPAEDVTIFTKHILSIQHRVRTVQVLTTEQQAEWSKTLQEIANGAPSPRVQ